MANRSLILAFSCLLAMAAPGWASPTPTPPTGGINEIKNGKLITPLDANNFPIHNLDIAGSGLGGGGGGGGGSGLASITGDDGTATGLTLAITHTTGSNLTDPVFTLGATLSAAHGGTGVASLGALKTAAGLDHVDNTADVDKPISSAATTALNLKLEAADLAAFAGTSNIVTLGTIATGVWSGTALVAGKVPALNSITAPTGDVSLNAHKITSLADPSGATDATNKQYVDAVSSTGPPHPAVAVASTANLTLSGEQTIDGVLTSASRILVKNQTSASANGIYVTGAGAWTRATDADANAEVSGSVFVSGGTINGGTTWGLTTPQPVTLGSTSLAYTQTGANTIYSATGGITLSGAQFSLSTMPTLTLKGNSTGSTAAPGDITYSTLKSGLSLNSVENTALSTWGGSSNLVTLGTVTSGTIPSARIQNITTTGSNLLTSLAATSNNTFIRINSIGGGGGTTQRTASELLGDISGQTAISVTSPLALTAGGALSIPAATDLVAGHLTATDHQAFVLKVPPGRTITTTAPLRISTSTTPLSGAPGSDLSANRTIDMPAANSSTDGYITGTAFGSFNNKMPPDSVAILTNSGTTSTPATWTFGATTAIETQGLTGADKYVTLPPVTNYAPGKRIIYTDNVTDQNFGRWFRRNGGDLLNGGTADFRPFIAGKQGAYNGKSAEFISTGIGWQIANAAGTVFHVEDGTDASKQVFFDASLQTPGTAGLVTAAPGNSVTVTPTDANAPGVILNIGADGSAPKAELSPNNLSPSAFVIGSAGNAISDATVATVTNSGMDTIWIAGSLAGTLTIKLRPASEFSLHPGQQITVVDFSGTVNKAHPVTITTTNGTDTFNGTSATSVTFDEANGKRLLTTDGVSAWSVPTPKASAVKPFQVLTASSGVFTLVPDTEAANGNKAHMVLGNGANTLVIPNPYDSLQVFLTIVQPASGAAGTLSLPVNSAVLQAGAGQVSLSTANSSVDTLEGTYNGALGEFLWKAPSKDYTTGALPAAPTAITLGTVTASTAQISWTDNASTETGFDVERSNDNVTFGNITTLAPNTVTFTDAGLTPASTYYYKVRAFNSGGYSAFTGTQTVTTSASCNTAGDTSGTGANNGVSIASGSNGAFFAQQYTVTTGNTSICAIDVGLWYNTATPLAGQTFTAEIRTDSGSNTPATGAALATSSNMVTSAQVAANLNRTSALATPLRFTFSSVTLSVGVKYWVVVHASSVDTTGTSHPFWISGGTLSGVNTYHARDVGGLPFLADGVTPGWISQGSTTKLYFKTNH